MGHHKTSGDHHPTARRPKRYQAENRRWRVDERLAGGECRDVLHALAGITHRDRHYLPGTMSSVTYPRFDPRLASARGADGTPVSAALADPLPQAFPRQDGRGSEGSCAPGRIYPEKLARGLISAQCVETAQLFQAKVAVKERTRLSWPEGGRGSPAFPPFGQPPIARADMSVRWPSGHSRRPTPLRCIFAPIGRVPLQTPLSQRARVIS